jgi:hypothetical protein
VSRFIWDRFWDSVNGDGERFEAGVMNREVGERGEVWFIRGCGGRTCLATRIRFVKK